MESETWAFIDEYGNPNLDTQIKDVSNFFIVSAVILDATALVDVRAALDVVRRNYFQTGELKSRNLRDNRSRWVSVLSALAPIPFRFAGFVADKRLIDRDSGLQWKQSFYKNLCGRLYGKLMKAYPALRTRADRYGTDEFKQSFAKYIEKNHRPTLFDRGTFALIDNLRGRGIGDKGEAWFRMNVIAPLRDQGLLLTSSSTGYKLPTCPDDLATFVNHAETVCIPMLQRAGAACRAVKLATQGQVDVLALPDKSTVRALIDALQPGPLE
jgi:hypothetical protein